MPTIWSFQTLMERQNLPLGNPGGNCSTTRFTGFLIMLFHRWTKSNTWRITLISNSLHGWKIYDVQEPMPIYIRNTVLYLSVRKNYSSLKAQTPMHGYIRWEKLFRRDRSPCPSSVWMNFNSRRILKNAI